MTEDNKKLLYNSLIFAVGCAILFVLLVPLFTEAAGGNWTYEQTFETLDTGDLNGQDSWSGDTGFDVVSSVDSFEGTKMVSVQSTGATITRGIDVDYGTFYISVKRSAISGLADIYLRISDSSKVIVRLDSSGNIAQYDSLNDHWTNLVAYSADTWYRIGLRFDCTAGGYQGLSEDTYQVNIDGGDWYTAENFAPVAKFDQIRLLSNDSGTLQYFDLICPDYYCGEFIYEEPEQPATTTFAALEDPFFAYFWSIGDYIEILTAGVFSILILVCILEYLTFKG